MTGIGLTHFAARAAALRFERAAKAGLVAEARSRKWLLEGQLCALLDSFEGMLECGVPKSAIKEALRALHDPISDADTACNKVIDEASEYYDDIDMTEAAALLEKVSA